MPKGIGYVGDRSKTEEEKASKARRIELAKEKKKRAKSAPHILGGREKRRSNIRLAREELKEAKKS